MKTHFNPAKFLVTFILISLNPLCAQTSSSSPVSTIVQAAKMYHLTLLGNDPKWKEPLADPQIKLLEEGLRWVSENVKCEKLDGLQCWQLDDSYKPRLDKCSDLNDVNFVSFDESGSPELLLSVSGGIASGNHGYDYTDEKIVFCHDSKKGFSAKVLEEDHEQASVQILKRPNAPDLLWIGDFWNNPMFDTPPGQARVYQEVDGELKKVLTYEYILTEWQRPDGFDTRLLPDEKGNIHLLKYTRDSTDPDTNPLKKTYTETTFKWSSFWKEYKKVGDEKPVSEEGWKRKSDFGTTKSIF